MEKDDIKNIFIALTIVMAVIVCLGLFFVQYTGTIGLWQKNAEREVFKETTTYNEAAASFLAESYSQYNEASSNEDKLNIMSYVILRYPNLDTSKIENLTLKDFYNKCLKREVTQ